MSCLIDTNILVYRFDPRDPNKQRRATEVTRQHLVNGTGRLAHQGILEFVAAVTRPLKKDPHSFLLTREQAVREAEELMRQFEVLYPCAAQVRLAMRGWSTYGLGWFDAHMWSMAEHYGLTPLLSENFEDGRIYGAVRVVNPFRALA